MSMSGYTKLFSSILASTVWREDHITRIVWITLLAMADKHGVAEGSIPGLADFARVTVTEAQAALLKLSSDDEFSRSKEHGGKRICAVDGGWQILNHAKYRAKMSADERREYLRVKQAEYRKRKPSSTNVNNVSPASTVLTHTEAEAAPEADLKAKASTDGSALRASFDVFWESYPRKTGKAPALALWLRLKPSPELATRMATSLADQCRSEQWTRDGGQFVPHAKTWLSQERWNDVLPVAGPKLSAEQQRMVAKVQPVAPSERSYGHAAEIAAAVKAEWGTK